MRVVVVGGGIGGLCAAVALTRAGAEVVVLEQARGLTAAGASLQLGPNATRLLGALGLLTTLRPLASRPDTVALLRWDDGSLLHCAEHGDAAESHFGAPQLDFFRPELHRVLAASLGRAELRLGARVAGIEDAGREVRAVLDTGERVAGDALIAADGLRSPLRQQLVGADDPVFSGTVVYRGVIPRSETADLHPDRVNRYWLGPYRHGVSYWISAGRLLALNLGVQRAAQAEESWTSEATAREALAYLDGWHEPLRERVRRCGTLLRTAVFVRKPLANWTYGRVTLLGDAAHAMEPFQAQGAAQAVEDAFVLGACVTAADGDLPAALVRYERIRMGRAEELQRSAHGNGLELFLPDGPEQCARDETYARLHETLPWGTRQRLWEYDVRAAL